MQELSFNSYAHSVRGHQGAAAENKHDLEMRRACVVSQPWHNTRRRPNLSQRTFSEITPNSILLSENITSHHFGGRCLFLSLLVQEGLLSIMLTGDARSGLTGDEGPHGVVQRVQDGVRGLKAVQSPRIFRRLGNWPAHRKRPVRSIALAFFLSLPLSLPRQESHEHARNRTSQAIVG